MAVSQGHAESGEGQHAVGDQTEAPRWAAIG
jgi:hypothetical protein